MAAAWAERLLDDRFVAADILSAGSHAWDGSEAAAYAIDAMRELGFDLRAHRSRRLSAELMSWADHVVVMEPMHAEVSRGLLDSAAEGGKIRGLWEHLTDAAGQVSDPQGQDLDMYRSSAREIGEALDSLLGEILAELRAQA
jgi:protein-tyrosine phosphatase